MRCIRIYALGELYQTKLVFLLKYKIGLVEQGIKVKFVDSIKFLVGFYRFYATVKLEELKEYSWIKLECSQGLKKVIVRNI